MNRTILYNQHKNLNSTFSMFGGYEMPLWYSSAKEEHINVIQYAGLFDTSHMSTILISGKDSKLLLTNSFSRDITNLKIGNLIYGLLLQGNNYVLDDTIIYKLSEELFMLVVNAGMSKKVIQFLKEFRFKDIQFTDLTDKVCKIDIQGPKSLKILEVIYGREFFDDFKYFSFKGNPEELLISRSGYTGEFGFELFTPVEKVEELWIKLLTTGKEYNLIPCGLASRDSLRVGAVLPLSHQDIGSWSFGNTPWDFAVDKNIVTDCKTYTYPFVGFDVRKLAEANGEVMLNNIVIGKVLTCISELSLARLDNKIVSITTPGLDKSLKIKGLSAGFILVNKQLSTGDIVEIRDSKRQLKVEIVKDIRPNRTARKSVENIRRNYE